MESTTNDNFKRLVDAGIKPSQIEKCLKRTNNNWEVVSNYLIAKKAYAEASKKGTDVLVITLKGEKAKETPQIAVMIWLLKKISQKPKASMKRNKELKPIKLMIAQEFS